MKTKVLFGNFDHHGFMEIYVAVLEPEDIPGWDLAGYIVRERHAQWEKLKRPRVKAYRIEIEDRLNFDPEWELDEKEFSHDRYPQKALAAAKRAVVAHLQQVDERITKRAETAETPSFARLPVEVETTTIYRVQYLLMDTDQHGTDIALPMIWARRLARGVAVRCPSLSPIHQMLSTKRGDSHPLLIIDPAHVSITVETEIKEEADRAVAYLNKTAPQIWKYRRAHLTEGDVYTVTNGNGTTIYAIEGGRWRSKGA